MKEKTISNGKITLKVSTHGAEITSLVCNGTEYIWQADPKFWARHSPVLFPIVGKVCGNVYRIGERQFTLGQHGFARDMDFTLLSESADELWFRLTDNAETVLKYPYSFILDIGYRISGKNVRVMWTVKNTSEKETMYFQIGAHPAFYLRDKGNGTKGYFALYGTADPQYILTDGAGCAVTDRNFTAELHDGMFLPILHDTFCNDALIFENHRIGEIDICDSDRKPYLRIRTDAPVTGLWAPSPESPFVCIEPWFGRCDRSGYNGDFRDKDWMQKLGPGQVFEAGYDIECL